MSPRPTMRAELRRSLTWMRALAVVALQACGDAVAPEPPVPVASVSVAPVIVNLPVGSALQLAATLKDSAGVILQKRHVTWTSSNAAIARVSETGLVTGVSSGSATITAAAEGQGSAAYINVGIPSPYDGLWSGATSDSRSASVRVLWGRVTDLSLSLGFKGSSPPPPCYVSLSVFAGLDLTGSGFSGSLRGSGWSSSVSGGFRADGTGSLSWGSVSFNNYRGCSGYNINGSSAGGSANLVRQS